MSEALNLAMGSAQLIISVMAGCDGGINTVSFFSLQHVMV